MSGSARWLCVVAVVAVLSRVSDRAAYISAGPPLQQQLLQHDLLSRMVKPSCLADHAKAAAGDLLSLQYLLLKECICI